MQTAFKKEDGIIIYADIREINSNIVSILKKRCTVREKQLAAGDYLLSRSVAAERKTTGDFLQSLVDGRLFEQLSRMKDSFASPLIIIEGETLFDERKIHPNAIRGALASIAIDMAIPILWTATPLETAEMLFAIAKREQGEKKKPVGIRGKRKFRSMNQQQEFLVCGLADVGITTAKNLLKHFGTPEKVFAASEGELQQVEGIGKTMAKKIRKMLTRRYEKSILED